MSMEHVPDSLALNLDGTRSLQYHTSDFHIYYSENITRKALVDGLDTLVADGIFGTGNGKRIFTPAERKWTALHYSCYRQWKD